MAEVGDFWTPRKWLATYVATITVIKLGKTKCFIFYSEKTLRFRREAVACVD